MNPAIIGSHDVRSLVQLGEWLKGCGYHFVTVTPETHRRVLAHGPRMARDVRDVFGWNRPFADTFLPSGILDLLRDLDVLLECEHGYRSAVRFSSLASQLFAHSGYPTTQSHSVFFGPDTYRFCAMVSRFASPARRVVDVGCGSGAGGLILHSRAEKVTLADLSDHALAYAHANALLAGREVELVRSDVLGDVRGEMDLVIANPPYMLDGEGRIYRDGAGDLGEGLALRIIEEALHRLSPGGRLLLYTGSAVVDGRDILLSKLGPLLSDRDRVNVQYEELDPDVFGEELDNRPYAGVERIAAVMLRATLKR